MQHCEPPDVFMSEEAAFLGITDRKGHEKKEQIFLHQKTNQLMKHIILNMSK